MMNKLFLYAPFLGTFLISQFSVGQIPSARQEKKEIKNKWQALETLDESGFLGERVDLWRDKRLWFVGTSDFLLKGFENRPGEHLWQGEHAGKWIHAATLAYESTRDPKLKKLLDATVARLLATQLPNGYMGTYKLEQRFYNTPADSVGWDVWTDRYNLYGLLAYEKYNPSVKIVDACKREADLLISVYGKGKADITKYGTRKGISATTLLESIVMLFERTKDKKYLDFAEEIVARSESNAGLNLMGAMLKNESVVEPGDGKAYQLMANLLGYLRLYQNTGNEKYLQTVLSGWQQIQKSHVLSTGGPWTRKMGYNGNKECFAHTEAFNPGEIVVENCVTVTWIQLNLHLLELTGLAKYFAEAEKTLFNHFMGGQHSDGIDWCYYTKPNETSPPYVPIMHCCASSGPRGLEMFSDHLVGRNGNVLSINNFTPSTIALSGQFGGGKLKIESNFPFSSSAKILFEMGLAKTFPVEFRLPDGSTLKQVSLNGKKINTTLNVRGYYQVSSRLAKGDQLSIDMDYKLQMHVQEGEKGKKWVAFSYGPVALAQKISEKPSVEPFSNFKPGVDQPGKILKRISIPVMQDGRSLVFKIQDSDITLIPYYQAGSRTSGPRTYFETAQ
ncbi:beta-L-arabinofuranosidase domain-containing protein [Daejeonella sp.]|uniref:beta-L-arabinofuranosidase domain-containing protein n=1 Tax=Daejeonella sp. TaxID=2805397 RepID=UPI0030BE3D13